VLVASHSLPDLLKMEDTHVNDADKRDRMSEMAAGSSTSPRGWKPEGRS
jgi:hypothetical protein